MKSNKEKLKSKSSKTKPKPKPKSEIFKLLQFGKGEKKNAEKKPIDDSKLSIREMKHADKYELFKIVSEFRQCLYINVYKKVFRSWFTYASTIILLGLSLTFISSKTSAIFLPPLIITVFLLWKVSRYKRMNRQLNINDMEMLNQNESFYFKYKSADLRRINQGVLLIFLKENKLEDSDWDLDKLTESDLETDSDCEDSEKHKKLIGYLVYNKEKDELETVSIREICIHSDYRNRKVATNFLRRVCLNVFRTYGYRRITFQVSSLDSKIIEILEKKSNLFNRLYYWVAYNFVPGVRDEHHVYSFDLAKINSF